ncbi:MAG: hypothetical protein EHM12_08125 [Dehalococcoidia bacterium]|nr:MAG: hypothetical protein EHM12_08125 [Dehalococcoidia bacterium]
MFNKEFWTEIKEKNPLAFEEFLGKNNFLYIEKMEFGLAKKSEFEHKDGTILVLPEKVCFCELVYYFDSLGIIIVTDYQTDAVGLIHYCFKINDVYYLQSILDRQLAELEAVKRAFDIREKQLKGGE